MTQIELEKSLHNDTIDMDTVADLEKMIERKKIEKLHRYKIFYNEKRDAWYTCHPLNYKRRIQRKTKEEYMGRIMGFVSMITNMFQPISQVIYGRGLEYTISGFGKFLIVIAVSILGISLYRKNVIKRDKK